MLGTSCWCWQLSHRPASGERAGGLSVLAMTAAYERIGRRSCFVWREAHYRHAARKTQTPVVMAWACIHSLLILMKLSPPPRAMYRIGRQLLCTYP